MICVFSFILYQIHPNYPVAYMRSRVTAGGNNCCEWASITFIHDATGILFILYNLWNFGKICVLNLHIDGRAGLSADRWNLHGSWWFVEARFGCVACNSCVLRCGCHREQSGLDLDGTMDIDARANDSSGPGVSVSCRMFN